MKGKDIRLDDLRKILSRVVLYPIGGKLQPICNTSRQDCYDVIFELQNILNVEQYRMEKAEEENIRIKGILEKQHSEAENIIDSFMEYLTKRV